MLNSNNEQKNIDKSKGKRVKNVIVEYQEQVIGYGTFAVVKKGIHRLTGEQVAIKIINKTQLTKDQSLRLKNQMQIVSNLFHSNIAKVYQIIQTTHNIYIIMEYCSNGQLYEKIKNMGKINEQQATKIFCQILSALTYLHEQNITHRDVKVQNIVFDKNNNAKLIDFGFAKKYQLFQFLDTLCGSIDYLAPEIKKKQKYQAELIDVWCLGVTLYVMLTAQFPFERNSGPLQSNLDKIKFNDKYQFSEDVQEIFQRIFKSSNKRINLKDLWQTNFVKTYTLFKMGNQVNSVNTYRQNIYIDQDILKEIESKFGVLKSEVRKSVISFKLDSNNSLYYLLMNKNRWQGSISPGDLSSQLFKKSLKINCRLKQLQQIKRKSQEKHYKQINIQKIHRKQLSVVNLKNVQRMEQINKKKTINIKKRIRETNIIQKCSRKVDIVSESPKRLLDKIKQYQIQ